MADLKEYHRQVSDIQKALRERELYHLELEKKNMMRLHRREKRHERLKAKIKTLQGELIQDELESTQRVTLLLAQVEAIKREYEMLEAQTERLRQKKIHLHHQLINNNSLKSYIYLP
ncbi:hypothetical protein SK128_023946 [Halocaridina rubra]|uniref:Uncharacterized protein n=1 Tax=Halocaridina rubra TaxID=373956 RepID=A0AAN8X5G8_HALRR